MNNSLYMLHSATVILCNTMLSKELNWGSLPVLLLVLFGRRRR